MIKLVALAIVFLLFVPVALAQNNGGTQVVQDLLPILTAISVPLGAVLYAIARVLNAHTKIIEDQRTQLLALELRVSADDKEIARLKSDLGEERIKRQGQEEILDEREQLVGTLRAHIGEQQREIEKIPSLTGQVEGLQRQVSEIRLAAEVAKKEMDKERALRVTAETERQETLQELEQLRTEYSNEVKRVADMQGAFVKERGEWQIERNKLNTQIADLTEQIKLHAIRLEAVEVIRQTPVNELPEIKVDSAPGVSP